MDAGSRGDGGVSGMQGEFAHAEVTGRRTPVSIAEVRDQGSGAYPAPAASDDVRRVTLVEFGRLREEIDNHMQSASALVGACLTSLGAGLAFFERFPDILIALAVASSLLGLQWIDHSAQILKLATYIAVRLSSRLPDADGRPLLGWETFLRRLDEDGQFRLDATKNIHRHAAWLFGGVPVALLMILLVHDWADLATTVAHVSGWIRLAGLLVAAVLWLVWLYFHLGFRELKRQLDDAVRMGVDPWTLPDGDGYPSAPSRTRTTAAPGA
jgi:hypothetical protein